VKKEREVVERDTVEMRRGYTGTAELYLTNFEHRHRMVVKCVNALPLYRRGGSSRYQLIRRLGGHGAFQLSSLVYTRARSDRDLDAKYVSLISMEVGGKCGPNLCVTMFQFCNFDDGSMAAVKTYMVFIMCPA
jgi:hypothetical protein